MKWREHFVDINNIPSEFADKEIEISDCLKIIDMLSFTIKELMNKSWHTSTPTEKGWYVCKLRGVDIYETEKYTGNEWGGYIEKWQKIEDEEASKERE